MKTALAPALLLAATAALAQVPGPQRPPARNAEAAVYIAGNRFTLEQAVADATLAKVGGASPFAIVATERETGKLTVKGSKPGLRNAVRQLQRAGGTFYLCERELKQAGLGARDLLPGVRVERGWNRDDLLKANAAADSADLARIRRVCS